MRLLPTNIQHIGDELAIAWSDGVESYLPLEALRRVCPCAACQGEPDVMGNLARPGVAYSAASFALRSWAIVGGYALQPLWADGHGSGLYPFPLLRQLAGQPSPAP